MYVSWRRQLAIDEAQKRAQYAICVHFGALIPTSLANEWARTLPLADIETYLNNFTQEKRS